MSNLYLEHHGIKGMKWGIRRYQNADGSYTSAGKDRYFGTTVKYNKRKNNYTVKYSLGNRKVKKGTISKEDYESIKEKSRKSAAEDAQYYFNHYKNVKIKDIKNSKEYKKKFDELFKSSMQENIGDVIFRSDHEKAIKKIMNNSNYSKEQAEAFFQMTGGKDPSKLPYEIIFNKDGSTTTQPKKKR